MAKNVSCGYMSTARPITNKGNMTTMIGFGQSRPCAGALLPYNSWSPGKVLTPGEKSGALLGIGRIEGKDVYTTNS